MDEVIFSSQMSFQGETERNPSKHVYYKFVEAGVMQLESNYPCLESKAELRVDKERCPGYYAPTRISLQSIHAFVAMGSLSKFRERTTPSTRTTSRRRFASITALRNKNKYKSTANHSHINGMKMNNPS